jgi:hypothetical protein
MQLRMSVHSSCVDIMILSSRGSGESMGILSSPERAFYEALSDKLPDKNVESIPFPYPAAGDIWTMVGAVVKIAFIGKYHASVTIGKRALEAVIIELNQSCPGTKVILVGYSQGAQVAGDIYKPMHTNNLYGAVLFGDPKFNPANGAINKYSFNPLRHGRLGTRSALGGEKAAHYLSYCHLEDPVCQTISKKEVLKVRFEWHKNYDELGEPEAAANYFADLIEGDYLSSVPDEWPLHRHDQSRTVEEYVRGWCLSPPEWTSCSTNICMFGEHGVGFLLRTDTGENFARFPISAEYAKWVQSKYLDPKTVLRKYVPSAEIVQLLRP